eukprot:c34093_g1_i1 orf=1-474(-)
MRCCENEVPTFARVLVSATSFKTTKQKKTWKLDLARPFYGKVLPYPPPDLLQQYLPCSCTVIVGFTPENIDFQDMATDRHKETEISRYGPFSIKSQATQTLPVHTQPPTQLMSHEVHQFTQLINHDAVEHVHVDTIVNDSEHEVSGDTIVLHDDDDDD